MTKRVRKRKKTKLKIGRIIIAFILLIAIVFGLYKITNFTKEKIIIKNYYIASNTNKVTIYSYNEETKQMEEIETIPRGQKVKSGYQIKTINENNYVEIKIGEKTYYIEETNLVENKDDVIKETEKFVRTSVTVYKNETDSKISSSIKKGNRLEIIGYDYYDKDGLVNMYEIKKDEVTGWVYGKYLVDTEESAKANYNESGVYDIHKDMHYSCHDDERHKHTFQYFRIPHKSISVLYCFP